MNKVVLKRDIKLTKELLIGLLLMGIGIGGSYLVVSSYLGGTLDQHLVHIRSYQDLKFQNMFLFSLPILGLGFIISLNALYKFSHKKQFKKR